MKRCKIVNLKGEIKMLETAKKLNNEIKEALQLVTKEAVLGEMSEFMTEETLAMYVKMYNLVNLSCQMMEKQAELIEDTNTKVTELIEKVKEVESN